ncbi:oligosaccharide flippase family protein [Streptococcus australis]|uniref:Lipopolysaccharide biosynthesis protein n=1 Tax=Streptococcus rubneri TaxID=1234680 RepID=A0A4Z1DUA5_9STRE|nr:MULTISPECIES: oligosaccharide flippase family protein [Streptococcus]MBK4774322.1 polysaccharide biosynthesis protein [Streptococcus rubneri]MBZ2154759.1 oligosaccharide flippase family protein [Streptococcus australis]TGN92151.1 lipopolysaccharide biosynthesis protein [Streptococcus rubneri]
MKSNQNVSTEKIYLWNLIGNLAFSGSSVLFTLIVTRLTSPIEADSFSLAYGIAAILVVVGMFQVRSYQATDVSFRHSFTSYFLARCISLTLMVLVFFPYLSISKIDLNEREKVAIIALYVLFRMCEAISDLFQGLFQQHERLDIAGKSMTIRYTFSTIFLFILLYTTKSLVSSLTLLVVLNFLFVMGYDFVKARSFERIDFSSIEFKSLLVDACSILKNCIPLFISGFLLAYIFNEPRIAIDMEIRLGHLIEGTQRDYNILFMPVFFMSLFILILRPLTTQLAIFWKDKEYKRFDGIIVKLLVIILGLGFVLTLVAYFIGTPILSVVFGLDLNRYKETLAILVFSGILYSIGIVFGDVMTVLRRQSYLLPVYLLMFVASKLTNLQFVQRSGLFGASLSFLLVMVVYFIGSIVSYWIARRLERKDYVL